MEHPGDDESHLSPKRGRSEVAAPRRLTTDLPRSRVWLAKDAEVNEQGISKLRHDLRGGQKMPLCGHSPFVQHHLRVPRRRTDGAQGNDQLNYGHVPSPSRSGILDQYFYALSWRSSDGARGRVWYSSSDVVRGLG